MGVGLEGRKGEAGYPGLPGPPGAPGPCEQRQGRNETVVGPPGMKGTKGEKVCAATLLSDRSAHNNQLPHRYCLPCSFSAAVVVAVAAAIALLSFLRVLLQLLLLATQVFLLLPECPAAAVQKVLNAVAAHYTTKQLVK